MAIGYGTHTNSAALNILKWNNNGPDPKRARSDQPKDTTSNVVTSVPSVASSMNTNVATLPNAPVIEAEKSKKVALAQVLLNGPYQYKHSGDSEKCIPSPFNCKSNTVSLPSEMKIPTNSQIENSTLATNYSGSILVDVLLNGSSNYRYQYKNLQLINTSSSAELLNGSPYYKKSVDLKNNPTPANKNDEAVIRSHIPTSTVGINDLRAQPGKCIGKNTWETNIEAMTNTLVGTYTANVKKLEAACDILELLVAQEIATKNGIEELHAILEKEEKEVIMLEATIAAKRYDVERCRSEVIHAEKKLEKVRELQNM